MCLVELMVKKKLFLGKDLINKCFCDKCIYKYKIYKDLIISAATCKIFKIPSPLKIPGHRKQQA